MTDCSFKTGDTIYSAGDNSSHTYIIKSGRVTISFKFNGKPIEIEAGPGDFIGDSAAVFLDEDPGEGGTYRATAIAATDVDAFKLPIDVLKAELAEASPILKNWVASFTDRALKVISKAME